MSSIEFSFEKACQDGTIPGAILMAADRAGTFTYAKAFGVRSLRTKEPLELDSVLFIASCTKLMTSIAAMQCIERGQASLDMDVAGVLPELAKADILTGFDHDRQPLFKKRENVITLRKADMATRDARGKLVHDDGPQLNDGAEDCFGGHGASASMPDYLEILKSILKDDERLLKKETTAIMFQPQLSDESREAMKKLWSIPAATKYFVGEFPQGVATDWGIGGLLIREAIEGWRRRNTLVWSGLPNLFWFIDREAGLCGLFGCQVTPPGDEKTGEMITLFEKVMYESIEKRSAKL
ncbi:hypothetical protein P7C71_g1395, partial [Lecanoromycetidae sp. Uapishka_2]